MSALPRGFREGHGGDLACPHRDISCCAACAAAHPEIVEVYSQHFWVSDPGERASLRRELGMSEVSATEEDVNEPDFDEPESGAWRETDYCPLRPR